MSCGKDAEHCKQIAGASGAPEAMAVWAEGRGASGHCPDCGGFLTVEGVCNNPNCGKTGAIPSAQKRNDVVTRNIKTIQKLSEIDGGYTEDEEDSLWEAMRELGRQGDPAAVPVLEEQLLYGEAYGTRLNAAEALGNIGGTEALDLLNTAIEDEDDDVRQIIATALGEFNDPKALEALSKFSNEKTVVEDAVKNARARIEKRVPLLNALQSGTPDERLKSVGELMRLKDKAAIPAIGKAALNDESWKVRASAVDALDAIDNPRVISPLERALTDKDSLAVRWSAAQALAKRGNLKSLPVLSDALSDESEGVQDVAEGLLGRLTPDAIPVLEQTLANGGDSDARWPAAKALGVIGGKAAIPALSTALGGDTKDSVRWEAAEALNRIGGKAAIPALSTALGNDSSLDVRESAAKALGNIGGKAAIPALSTALGEDEKDSVRWEAADALGKIGDPAAIPTLVETLKGDDSSIVRWSAAQSLGEIGDPAAIPALEKASEDKVPKVREYAARALDEIKGVSE